MSNSLENGALAILPTTRWHIDADCVSLTRFKSGVSSFLQCSLYFNMRVLLLLLLFLLLLIPLFLLQLGSIFAHIKYAEKEVQTDTLTLR